MSRNYITSCPEFGKEAQMKRIVLGVVSLVTAAAGAETLEEKVAALEQRVAYLEQRLEPILKREDQQEKLQRMRDTARARMLQDRKVYSREQLQAIESLYQQANRDLAAPEAETLLAQLISEYPKANRSGCAMLYLGQKNEGDQQIEYLQRCIDEFSDCFYGDGVQVGAYARYILAMRYRADGETAKAQELLQELAAQYPDAVTHSGASLLENIPAE